MKRFFFLLLLFPFVAIAQHSKSYTPPDDPLVVEKLAAWQDLKFGLLMHWGAYSLWGIVESWSLCPEDEGWTVRRGPYSNNWYEYKKAYENLPTQFNPVKFNPDKWAEAAKAAGMRYVVFTTKHHDGFSMFDTKQTDYKITASQVPFSSNPKSDVTKEIFSAFRKKDFMIGAYFSKPDWHNENFWWPYFPPKDRHVNYDIKRYPERWERFKDFTYNQIEELMTGYGKMDILWLDGGWVRPQSSIDPAVSWQATVPFGQDVDMSRIATMARKHQPGLIIVDRSVPGLYENYTTPEQEVPEKPHDFPWETCMTMAGSWSYVPNDVYKPARKLIHLLADIVAKGGNFLLNIAPGPDGEWHDEAYVRLQELGGWMKVNQEAIYGTKPIAPYVENAWRFTIKQNNLYALYLAKDGEKMPESFTITHFTPPKNSEVHLLGYAKPLKWKKTPTGTQITLPPALRQNPPTDWAWVIRMKH